MHTLSKLMQIVELLTLVGQTPARAFLPCVSGASRIRPSLVWTQRKAIFFGQRIKRPELSSRTHSPDVQDREGVEFWGRGELRPAVYTATAHSPLGPTARRTGCCAQRFCTPQEMTHQCSHFLPETRVRSVGARPLPTATCEHAQLDGAQRKAKG